MVVCIGKQLTDTEGKFGTIYHIEYNGMFRVNWGDGTKTLHPITQAPGSEPLQKIDLVHSHRTTKPNPKTLAETPPLPPHRESTFMYHKGDANV